MVGNAEAFMMQASFMRNGFAKISPPPLFQKRRRVMGKNVSKRMLA